MISKRPALHTMFLIPPYHGYASRSLPSLCRPLILHLPTYACRMHASCDATGTLLLFAYHSDDSCHLYSKSNAPMQECSIAVSLCVFKKQILCCCDGISLKAFAPCAVLISVSFWPALGSVGIPSDLHTAGGSPLSAGSTVLSSRSWI